MHPTSDGDPAPLDPQRRSFIARLAAIVLGGLAAVFPFAAGWGVLFDPLRRGRSASRGERPEATSFSRLCPLEALPTDGRPHPFVVTTEVTDAWTRSTGQRVGSVFLTRSAADGGSGVTALAATCPHLGCSVEFDAGNDRFECPCHESGFDKDGHKLFGPSLRGLDPLEVKLVDNGGVQEVWVAFRRFRAGMAERIPVA